MNARPGTTSGLPLASGQIVQEFSFTISLASQFLLRSNLAIPLASRYANHDDKTRHTYLENAWSISAAF